MPRLFVALPVPEPIAMALDLTHGGLHRARWIRREDYHLTLRFIGDVDDTAADQVATALGRVTSPPVEVVLRGYDAFGHDKPRSVHASAALSPALEQLQQEVEGACRHAGLAPETRKFTPHITVARLKSHDPMETARWLDGRAAPVPDRFWARRFGLWTAKTGGGGPYEYAVDYPLDAP